MSGVLLWWLRKCLWVLWDQSSWGDCLMSNLMMWPLKALNLIDTNNTDYNVVAYAQIPGVFTLRLSTKSFYDLTCSWSFLRLLHPT
jgi:hypothetical protein